MDSTEAPDVSAYFSGQVSERGALVLDDPGRWAGWLMRNRSKRVQVRIGRPKQKRSDQANRRYWSLIVPCFSEWSGYERGEAHEVLKAMFAREEVTLPSGEIVQRVKSTAQMSVSEFAEYTSAAERFLSGHGFQWPDMVA